MSPEARKDRVKNEFRRFFPFETWGDDVFVLQYEVGGHKIQLRRSPSRGKPSEGLILSLPPFCDDFFSDMSAAVAASAADPGSNAFAIDRRAYNLWKKIEPLLRVKLGSAYYNDQLFIPAGRAFFSNIENNVFSFLSHSERNIDPFLARFGAYFSYIKSGGNRQRKREYSEPLAKGLLGGKFVIEKDKEYVETPDNRILPLSNLSSGQQEALPLLMMLEPPEPDFHFRRPEDSRTATYIEEPEAHLFPDYQRVITERIAEYAMAKDSAHSVVITTHSPYVLSTLNNLLLAGRVGSRRGMASRVAEVIPASRWLPKGSVKAYAFIAGECRELLDPDLGLVDAGYLDSVSSGIASDFERLLDIGS